MDAKDGIMMYKLKGRMEKGYYVKIKRWMKKVAL